MSNNANLLHRDDDKCLSVQCIYCQQIRAKNTSRQKQHLLECPGLQNQPRPHSSPNDGGIAAPNRYPPLQGTPGQPPMSNGITPQGTPMQPMASRPAMPSQTPQPVGPVGAPLNGTPMRQTPKPQKTPKQSTPGSSLPAPPLDDVHAAFVEFRAKEEDKCLSVQCVASSSSQISSYHGNDTSTNMTLDASTAIRYERRTPHDSGNICSNVKLILM